MTNGEIVRQYLEQKQIVGEALLLLRVGDFYEIIGADAVTCAKALGLTLTMHGGHAMAGVPYHSVSGYTKRLVAAGHRVAISTFVAPARKAVTT